MATGQLLLWSSALGKWVTCPPDEITWLDRDLLSGNEDLTLHRAPRCAGLRYVHHRWELFSRDTTYRVYLAPGGVPVSAEAVQAEAVQQAARHVLPPAPARYEVQPVVLEAGSWLLSVGNWVLRLRLDVPGPPGTARAGRPGHSGREGARQRVRARRGGGRRVRGYFVRNTTARMSLAYYYQQFILGLPAPQNLPMMDVVIALDLSGEGAVSDYKKTLQSLIWKERGHARDLADFLLSNSLLTPADLDEAREVAEDNERRGISGMARERLKYRPRDA